MPARAGVEPRRAELKPRRAGLRRVTPVPRGPAGSRRSGPGVRTAYADAVGDGAVPHGAVPHGAVGDGAVGGGADERPAGAPRPGSSTGSLGRRARPASAYRLLPGLARSCHPVPTVAVTGIGCALAALVGDPAPRSLLIGAAVLAGQLSIGWSNDAIDAERDRTTRRADKPVAAGAVAVPIVARAAAVALLLAIVLAGCLGVPAGAAALVIVAAGWAYNAGLKATLWSWAPYAVAFGALPALATLARPGHPLPAVWAVASGALLGVAAHLANVAPDLADDLATGVRGLPHRLGPRATSVLGPLLLAAAAVTVFVGGGSGHSRWRILAFAVSLCAAASAAVIAARAEQGRRYFLATVVAAVLDVVLYGLSGHRLS